MSGPFGSSQWMYEAGGDFYPYPIDNSLRFDASSYLYRIPGTTGNRTTWTASTWIKRSNLGVLQTIFGALNYSATVNEQTKIFFEANDTIRCLGYEGTYPFDASSTAVFRDTAAWYHIVWVFDSTNATASLRSRVYVNGVEILMSGSYPPLNHDSFFNHANTQFNIGALADETTPFVNTQSACYFAEVNFVDGLALAPTDFGEYDSTSTVWRPKEYTGTYGTNGFHLDFADGTSATTLGYDVSGNSNNFTPSGIATSDQMLDSPTNNFCTINPLKIGSVTLSEGNLKHQHSGSTSWRGITPTMHVSSGKWYWEVAFNNLYTPPASTTQALVGIVSENETQTDVTAATYFTGMTTEAYGYYNYGGSIWNNNSGTAYGSTWGNATIGIALDLDSSPKTLEFFLNGVSQGVLQDGTHINLGDKAWGPGASTYYSSIASYNFGQFDFTYTPPSGFLALCSENLPDPTFDPRVGESPQDAFNVYTDTGANILSTAQSDYSDGLFWIKDYQNPSTDHQLLNTVTNTVLESNTTDAERAYSAPSGSSMAVAWAWNAPTVFSNNTDGVITSAGRVNQNAGFSIVNYTTSATVHDTVGHALGETPAIIIAKQSSEVETWVLLTNLIDGSIDYLKLQTTDAKADYTSGAFTATTFTNPYALVGTDVIAYCFVERAGFSKFGTYVGNGVDDGPFVYLGFRPAFIMFKCTSSLMNWSLQDAARSPSNAADDVLYPNLSNSQDTSVVASVDFLSNGFKIRNAAIGWINNPGSTFFYMAFAESPFKYSNAR